LQSFLDHELALREIGEWHYKGAIFRFSFVQTSIVVTPSREGIEAERLANPQPPGHCPGTLPKR
jgi:hypothetical protein